MSESSKKEWTQKDIRRWKDENKIADKSENTIWMDELRYICERWET